MADAHDPRTRRLRARVGQTLRGKWQLERLLGAGGMACVYAATHRNGMRGAVKVLHLELSADDFTRTRFLREGYAANRVGHPGVVRVLDDDVADDGAVFLVMELLDGESLSGLAATFPQRRVPVPLVLDIAHQLLDVLAAAHDQGIIHRDIKPDNLFWTHEGRLKVLDFGIARLLDLPGGPDATKTGNLLGTPPFMPPEQALGEHARVNARTDLWAAGATMFTMLTGRRVREADSANKMLLAAMTQPAPPLHSVNPAVPIPLATIVDRALALPQADRFPDARAMAQAVRECATRIAPEVLPRLVMLTPAAPVPRVSTNPRAMPQPELAGHTSAPMSLDVMARNRTRTTWIAGLVAATALGGVGAAVLLGKALRGTSAAPVTTVTLSNATAAPVKASASASAPRSTAAVAKDLPAPSESAASDAPSSDAPATTSARPATRLPGGRRPKDPLDKF